MIDGDLRHHGTHDDVTVMLRMDANTLANRKYRNNSTKDGTVLECLSLHSLSFGELKHSSLLN